MIAAVLRGALLAVAGVGMAGCVATRYDTIPYDTAKPAELAGVPGCRDRVPNKNESCVTLVRARDWQTRSDLEVDERQAWCIEVPEGQHWFDKSRISSPLRGEPGNDLMKPFEDWKRVRGAPWFVLVVAVVTKASKDADERAVGQLPVECSGRLFRPSQPGMLVFYPNDAVLPAGRHSLFYGNNGGQIWVKLTRLQ